MSRKFAVFDIDGTIFRSSLYIEIIYTLAELGAIKLPSDESHVEALEAWRSRKSLDAYINYRQTLVDLFEPQIKGMLVSDLELAAERVIENQAEHTYVYPVKLIEKLKSEGYFLIAVSGSQIELVERFAKYWGFDDWVGQIYERQDDRFSGVIHKTHEGKGRFLDSITSKHDLTKDASYAIGDSMGDIELLETVEQPIAFNPERELLEVAKMKGWKIVVERKSVIYELEVDDDGKHIMAETS